MPDLTLDNIISPPDIHTIDIWKIPLDTPSSNTDSLIKVLDAHEIERYENFHQKLKHAYLCSHAACRQILSRYLNVPAKEIQYKKNKYGKPLLNHDTPIQFNLSHSYSLAVIAISSHADLGVDIEYNEKKSAWEKIARRYFHPAEIEYLFKQKKSKQKKTFFQIWTRKESYIKALGTGFSTPFSSFNVIAEKITNELNILVNDKQNWFQQDLGINPNYTAAVVQNTSIEKIRYYSY